MTGHEAPLILLSMRGMHSSAKSSWRLTVSSSSLYAYEANAKVIKDLNHAARTQLQLLLETKHLYQKVTIHADRIIDEARQRVTERGHQAAFHDYTLEILTARLPPSDHELLAEAAGGTKHSVPHLLLPHVKVFCDKCEGREAFKPIWYVDVANVFIQQKPLATFEPNLPATFQLFVLIYQCQRCKGTPVGFIVRRDGWNLILDGRSPFEQVEVPKYIPNTEKWLYRDAMVSIHAGKTLAAQFYLRTFIEQFARRQTGLTEKITGDDLMTEYSSNLPDKIRDMMPSLREWYEKLSVAIHQAREDPALFEQARGEIDRHFDMRRVHRIAEKS
jgi:hypothetical protein